MPTFIQQEYLAPDAPKVVSPGPGSGIGGSSVVFTWVSPTLNVDSYRLTLGSTQDGTNYHDSGALNQTTDVVTGIPYDAGAIHATLYFTNSGVTRFVRYQYTESHPRIRTPVAYSEQPIGNIPIKWAPADADLGCDVTITGKQSGVVYFLSSANKGKSAFWRVSASDLNAQDTQFVTTVKWLSGPLTLTKEFILHSLPALNTPYDVVTPDPSAFSILGTLVGSTDTLSFPTTVNLFRDGKETRFTTSETPLYSQQATVALPGIKQNEFMHYVRKVGRNYTWLPAPAHTLWGSLLGDLFTLGTGVEFSWMWTIASHVMVVVPTTDQFMVIPLVTLNSSRVARLGFTGFSDAESGEVSVQVCPCIPQVPDFLEVTHAGRRSASAKVKGLPTALPVNSQRPLSELSLAHDVNGKKVLPVLSPFSSRKFTQLIESTTATHNPEYFPIGKQAIDLSAYTFAWTDSQQLIGLVNFFLDIKGAQESFILTDYMSTLPVVASPTVNSVRLSYASDKQRPVTGDFRYLVVLKGQNPVSIHKVTGFTFEDYDMIVTLDEPLSSDAQSKLTDCSYSLCEGVMARVTDSTITMTHQGMGKGSCSLSFTEVVE